MKKKLTFYTSTGIYVRTRCDEVYTTGSKEPLFSCCGEFRKKEDGTKDMCDSDGDHMFDGNDYLKAVEYGIQLAKLGYDGIEVKRIINGEEQK